MKKLIALLLLCGNVVIAQSLMITEITDPQNSSDAGRYIEIYNPGTGDVDLSTGYALQRWTNGNVDPHSAVSLTGMITAGGFYVVCNNTNMFVDTYGLEPSQTIPGTGGSTAVTNSNGDDNIALLGPDGSIIDIYGVPGQDGSLSSGGLSEFEDGRAERACQTSASSVWIVADWNIDNDSGGGDGNQYAPEGFDPFSWDCSDDTAVLCDDGNICNGYEVWDPIDELCVDGEPLMCDDGDPNTIDTCDENTGCVNTLICDDIDEDNICDDQDDCVGSYDACGVCDGDNTTCGPEPLFFSEYAEGSSSNKYFEIYNPTDETVDLSYYQYVNCSNGCDDWEYNNDFAEGATIAPGSVYTVCHGSYTGDQTLCSETITLYYNGNDAQGIIHVPTNTLLDVIGDIATSNTYWDVAGVSEGTEDHTIVRKCGIAQGNTDWASSAGTTAEDSEWVVYEQNYWDDLGAHLFVCPAIVGCMDDDACNYDADAGADDGSCLYLDCLGECGGAAQIDGCGVCNGDNSTCSAAPLFFSEHAEGSSSNKYFEIYNPTDEIVDLSNYQFVNCSNGCSFANAEETVITWEYYNDFAEGATIAPGSVYTVCHGSYAYAGDQTLCNETRTLYHNGDDTQGLMYTPTNTLLDIFGELVFEDPGYGWEVAGVADATRDHTLVRKCGITQGNTDWASSAGTSPEDSEWVVYDQNYWDDLGSHVFTCPVVFDVPGCTDSEACNYNIDATVDNGTCGLVDDCGDCQVPYCYVSGGNVSYVGINDCPGGVEGNSMELLTNGGVWVGTDSSDTFFWLGSDANIYWNQNCSSTPGCTDNDPLTNGGVACNYNYAATEDNGSCTYATEFYNCPDENGFVTCINDGDGDGVCDEFEVQGCMNDAACNYNMQATDDDGNCEFTSCLDCAGTPFGNATEDNCGTCDSDPTNDCEADCAGVFGGDSVYDQCGTCDNDSTNDCEADCAGEYGGDAVADMCGTCDNDSTNDCEADCAGEYGGSAELDLCGVCNGDNTTCGPEPLFFSEYAEGSSSNKYFEIYNPTDETVDLSYYQFVNCQNECDDWEFDNYFAEGATIAPGSVYTVCHGSYAGDQTLCNETRTLYHNGNDAQGIIHVPTNTLLDVIGDIATSNTYWDVAGVSEGTKDHTIVRKCGIAQGNTDWNSSAGTTAEDSEWVVYEQNYWDDLGAHLFVCPAIVGCMDDDACNYDADAGGDDGSCIYPNECNSCTGDTSCFVNVTFSVDMSVEGVLETDGVLNEIKVRTSTENGEYNPSEWVVMDDSDGDMIYTATMSLAAGIEYGYNFNNSDGNGYESGSTIDTCAGGNYGNDRVVIPGTEDMVLDTVCWESCEACPEIILGCMNSSAYNYDETATEDDGSCVTELTGYAPLFFSEYAEGSSNNKYLEIYNPTTETVNLSSYAYPNASNGSDGTFDWWNSFDEGAEIAPGGVYVIAHPSSDPAILAFANETHNYLSNGDDGFALVYGFEGYSNSQATGDDCPCINPDWIDDMAMCTFIYDPVIGCDGNEYSNSCLAEAAGITSYTPLFDGPSVNIDWTCTISTPNFVILDRIGDWNEDPGSGWEVAGVAGATENQTLVRKCGITQGNTDWLASAGTNEDDSEWIVLDQNDWTYLGSHDIECPVILGCTDGDSSTNGGVACNYNSDATDDDGSCQYPATGYDCDGNCLETFTIVVDCLPCTETEFLVTWTEFDLTTCTYTEMCECQCIDADSNGVCDSEEQQVSQSIDLVSGWSMWSTYISPEDATMPTLFNNIENDLVIVKDEGGNVYWPSFDLNSIGSIQIGKGYQVKMSSANTLVIEGDLIPFDTSFNLVNGWNIMGYLHQEPYSVESMMSTMNSSNLTIMKDSWGNVYWPQFALNNIGDLSPGQGYQIKLAGSWNFSYPAGGGARYGDVYTERPVHFEEPANTGNNMIIGFPLNSWESTPTIGDEIAAYGEDGELIGSTTFQGDHIALTIWGDDLTTDKKDGIAEGESISLKLWNSQTGVENSLDVRWSEGVGFYTTDGISIAGQIILGSELTTQKELVRITDMLGRDVNGDEKDVMLLYIYDDGSIERVYIKE